MRRSSLLATVGCACGLLVAIALLFAFSSCSEDPQSVLSPDSDSSAPPALSPGDPATVAFDDIALGEDSWRVVSPYVDLATSIIFAIKPIEPFGGAALGLVKNQATAECVPEADNDQKLGTTGSREAAIGSGSVPLRATFPTLLQSATITVEVQTLPRAHIHMRLFGPAGKLVASRIETAVPSTDRACGSLAHLPSRNVVIVASSGPVAAAEIWVTAGEATNAEDDAVLVPPRGRVPFVIDNFRYGPLVEVSFDIFPGHCPNTLYTDSKDPITAAVLGSAQLDVSDIDVSTLTLDGALPLSSAIEDVSAPAASPGDCECAEVDPDGFDDLVLEFETQDVIDALGPFGLLRSTVNALSISGQLMDGTPFEATDCVVLPGRPLSDELISTPLLPEGAGLTVMGANKPYCTDGAVSTLGHPIEYRFDFDSRGAHDYSEWFAAPCALQLWETPGRFHVTAQARCAVHPSVVSAWSAELAVAVNSGPDTEFFAVLNTYRVGGEVFQDTVDVFDAVPDTIPFRSWITLFYIGSPNPEDTSSCEDRVNECLSYQVNYTWRSDNVPFTNTSSWLPIEPEDSNPFGPADTTSMNAGTVNYTIRARAVDEHSFVDQMPPEILVFGNHSPTLDDAVIKDHTGDVIDDGGSIQWDWWNPANLDPLFPSPNDTLDLTDPSGPQVVKEFRFVIEASGHDHPKEQMGVKSWFYLFRRADDPSIIEPFARTGFWVEGITVNALSDTFVFEIRYSLFGDPGGVMAFENLPDWINRGYDYSVRGRDVALGEEFRQKMILNGEVVTINAYGAHALGRETEEGGLRFDLTIER